MEERKKSPEALWFVKDWTGCRGDRFTNKQNDENKTS